jgi:hypothetical protein
MTHEHAANDEHPEGPEHDQTLPDAAGIPGDLSPEESDAPELGGDL